MDTFSIDGTIAAPGTAFHPNGDINTGAIESYVDFLVRYQIDGVFILGTLGEGMSLTVDERKTVAAEWVKQGKDKLKALIVQVGAGNLRDSIELAKHANTIKASAIACVSPTYFKPKDEESMVDYLAQVASAAPNTPFYYYCINFVTGVYLNTPKILELCASRIPNFRGAKFSSKEFDNLLDCTRVCGGKLNIMIGTDEQFLPALSLGIKVPVVNGYLGPVYKRLKKAFDEGDTESALKEHYRARDIKLMEKKYGSGPVMMKAIMKCYGIDLGPVRLPLKDMSDSLIAELKSDMLLVGMLSD